MNGKGTMMEMELNAGELLVYALGGEPATDWEFFDGHIQEDESSPAIALARWIKPAPKVGMPVLFNGGFPGTVTSIYDHGTERGVEWWMVEVRGPRGGVCISWRDCELVK